MSAAADAGASAASAAPAAPVAATESVFDAVKVARRVKKIRAAWQGKRDDPRTWKGTDAIVVVHGKRNTTNPNAKPLLFERYLLAIGKSTD